MTPEESRDQLVDVVDQTAALFEGDPWEETQSPSLGPCALGSTDGVSYDYTKIGAPDANPNTAVERVAALWEDLGIETRTRLGNGIPAVFGTGGPVLAITFSADHVNYSVGGTSLCVPGDFVDMVLDDE